MNRLAFIKRIVRVLQWCTVLCFLVCAVGAVLMFMRYNRAPRITVVNQSGQVLEGIVIRGNGFECVIPILQPGHRETFSVVVSGESGISLECQAGARRVSAERQGYIEARGGYRATLTVTDTLEVRCSSGR